MISDYLMTKILTYIKDQAHHAKIVIDGEEMDGEILRAEITKDYLLKIFVSTPRASGQISDIKLYDDKNNVVISKPQNITKTKGYGLVSSFYINLIEREIADPKGIFTLMGGIDG